MVVGKAKRGGAKGSRARIRACGCWKRTLSSDWRYLRTGSGSIILYKKLHWNNPRQFLGSELSSISL